MRVRKNSRTSNEEQRFSGTFKALNMYSHNMHVNLCGFLILPTNQMSDFARQLERLNKVHEIQKIPA